CACSARARVARVVCTATSSPIAAWPAPATLTARRARRSAIRRPVPAWRAEGALLADHVDVLAERVLSLLVEIDVTNPHVHRGLAVGPHHLALHRNRGIEVGEVEDQVHHRAHLFHA